MAGFFDAGDVGNPVDEGGEPDVRRGAERQCPEACDDECLLRSGSSVDRQQEADPGHRGAEDERHVDRIEWPEQRGDDEAAEGGPDEVEGVEPRSRLPEARQQERDRHAPVGHRGDQQQRADDDAEAAGGREEVVPDMGEHRGRAQQACTAISASSLSSVKRRGLP